MRASTAIRVTHDEQSALIRHAEQDEAVLTYGVLRVRNGRRKSVVESGGGLAEGDAVLPNVLLLFPRVPLEIRHDPARGLTPRLCGRAAHGEARPSERSERHETLVRRHRATFQDGSPA